MKKYLSYIIPQALLVLFLCCYTTPAQAQSPACQPDCFNEFFTPPGMLPPIEVEVPGQPGCSLRITYGYRNACNVWHDFYIYNVEAYGNCDPNFLADVNAVVQTATQLLLLSNPPVDMAGNTVGPNRPANCDDVECVLNWRVIKGTCWKDYGGVYAECEETACCLTPYQVCRDYCDNITVTKLGGGFSSGCASTEAGCFEVCN